MYNHFILFLFIITGLFGAEFKHDHTLLEGGMTDYEPKGDNVFYIGGDSLTILNFSNPSFPEQISRFIASGQVYDLAIHDEYVYLAVRNKGISIIKTADLGHLKLAGSLDTENDVFTTAIFNAHLYTVSGYKLQVYSLQDPTNPVFEGELEMDQPDCKPKGVHKSYLYLQYDRGIRIVNIGTKSNPYHAGYMEIENLYDLAVDSGYLYVATGKRIDIYDLTNGWDPRRIRALSSRETFLSLEVANELIYASTRNSTLLVYTMDDPANPVKIRSIPTEKITNLHYRNRKLYGLRNSLYVFDATSVSDLALVSSWDAGVGLFPTDIAFYDEYLYLMTVTGSMLVYQDTGQQGFKFVKALPDLLVTDDFKKRTHIKIFDNKAYLFCDDRRLKILDLSVPDNPQVIASYMDENTRVEYKDIFVKEHNAYLAAGCDPDILILDLSDLNNIRVAGSYSNRDFCTNSVTVKDNYLYAGTSRKGITLNIGNPEQPYLVDNFCRDFNIDRISVHDDVLYFLNPYLSGASLRDPVHPEFAFENENYVASDYEISGQIAYIISDRNLYALNILNPYRSDLEAEAMLSSTPHAIEPADSMIFLSNGKRGLAIFSLNGPVSNDCVAQNTRLLSKLYLPGESLDIQYSGSLLFIASGQQGVHVVDVSNAYPNLIGNVDVSGSAHSVFIKNDYLFSACGYDGVEIWNIGDPKNPFWVSGVETMGRALHVKVNDACAFIAEDSAGATVVNIQNIEIPLYTGSYYKDGPVQTLDVDDKYLAIFEKTYGCWKLLDINVLVTETRNPLACWGCTGFLGFFKSGEVEIDDFLIYYTGTSYLYNDKWQSYFCADSAVPGWRYNRVNKDRVLLDGIVGGFNITAHYAFIATGEAGFEILDITDKDSFKEAGFYYTGNYVYDVAVIDSIAYLATEDGLTVLSLDLPFLTYSEPISNLEVSNEFILKQNYPNPFNSATLIEFSLSENLHTELTVYNCTGQKVANILDRLLAKGPYRIRLGTSESGGTGSLEFSYNLNLPSGVYYYRLQTGNKVETRKMVLIK